MLLIGSRAAKYHFPFARKPFDYDFIASKNEVMEFLSKFDNYKIQNDRNLNNEKKISAQIIIDENPILFEFELIEQSVSGKKIYIKEHFDGKLFQDNFLKEVYSIASPEILFLLKKSHICFNIHWKKNICDYLSLKERIDQSSFDKNWNDIFNLRFEETKSRIKYKERNFNVSNSDFFKVSEKMVNRVLPHDGIHYATCFYERPLFMEVKDDLSKAEMNSEKVFALSHQNRIRLIQEECIALAIERYIIPCLKNNKSYDVQKSFIDTACRMVYNYLPMFLRFFAADNFMEILNLQFDYVEKFLTNVKNFELSK